MGPCQAPGTEPGRDAKALGLHIAGWHRLPPRCLAGPSRGAPGIRRQPRSHLAQRPRGNSQLPPLPFLSLGSGPVCSKAGQVTPAGWVSGCRGALPLCARCVGLPLPPGVVNCPASVIVTSVFKSSPSSLLLPPGSRKLTSCLSDLVFLGPGSSPPRPGDGGSGSGAPPVTAPSVPMSSSWPDLVCFCLLG